MKNGSRWQFFCPRCNQSASKLEVIKRSYATEALAVPYFVCSNCRLICISKQAVRNAISEWWHRTRLDKEAPFKYFYNESISYLYLIILDYYQRIGYKAVRFKKRQH